MVSTISDTGFWSADDAHIHHVHCHELANWLSSYFSEDIDKPLYDFGCGLGNYLKNFQNNGFTKLQGFEGDPAELKVFDNIVQQDLTKPFSVPVPGNVLFLEVAEHVPAEFENQLLDNITNACDSKLVMSWGIPGQAGFGHVNCQPFEYVVSKMKQRGFVLSQEKTYEARSLNLDSASWFYNTLFVFLRG